MDRSTEHDSKVESLMALIFDNIVIFVSELHFLKAHLPILVTPLGIVMLVKPEPRNALFPIEVTVDGIVMDVMLAL